MDITGEQVINAAKRMLKLTMTNEFDADMSIWLQKGYKKLYNLKTYLPYDVYLPISNLRAKLPRNFHEFIGAAVQANTPLVYYNNKYYSTATSPNPIEIQYYNFVNETQIIGNYLVLPSLATGADEVHLWFYGVPIDDACNLIVDSEAEEALKYYIAWKFSEENNGADFEKKIQYYATMFDKESGIYRGHLAKLDSRQRKYQLTSTSSAVLNFFNY